MLGVAAAAITLLGGLAALRFSRQLWLLLSVAAGVIVGVSVFDLYPEAIALGEPLHGLRPVTVAFAIGFGFYLLLGRGFGASAASPATWRQHIAPATLALHSVVDGLGIGLAFQIGTRSGWLVAFAVLAHDFADGVNTVGVSLASRDAKAARLWLGINSAAPICGVLLGEHLRVSSDMLALLLAGFAGAFLHIGACELIPRSRLLEPRSRTAAASLAGLALMAVITGLAR
jgi:zinc transporter ZupT